MSVLVGVLCLHQATSYISNETIVFRGFMFSVGNVLDVSRSIKGEYAAPALHFRFWGT